MVVPDGADLCQARHIDWREGRGLRPPTSTAAQVSQARTAVRPLCPRTVPAMRRPPSRQYGHGATCTSSASRTGRNDGRIMTASSSSLRSCMRARMARQPGSTSAKGPEDASSSQAGPALGFGSDGSLASPALPIDDPMLLTFVSLSGLRSAAGRGVALLAPDARTGHLACHPVCRDSACLLSCHRLRLRHARGARIPCCWRAARVVRLRLPRGL